MSTNDALRQRGPEPAAVPTRQQPKLCRKCGDSMLRISRAGWMRLIPTSRLYYCDGCCARQLDLLGAFSSLR